MQVVILGPNLMDQSKGGMHVHAAGCADTKKANYRHHREDADNPFSVYSKVDVAEIVYDPHCFEWDPTNDGEVEQYLSDIYFFPCADHLPFRADRSEVPAKAPEPVEPKVTLVKVENVLNGAQEVQIDGLVVGVVYREGSAENPRWFAIPATTGEFNSYYVAPTKTLWTRKEAVEALTSQWKG